MADCINNHVAEFFAGLERCHFSKSPIESMGNRRSVSFLGNVAVVVADRRVLLTFRVLAENVRGVENPFFQPQFGALRTNSMCGWRGLVGRRKTWKNSPMNCSTCLRVSRSDTFHARWPLEYQCPTGTHAVHRHRTDWGTDRYTALELIETRSNLKTPTGLMTRDKKARRESAPSRRPREEKRSVSKERFKEWVWSDFPTRTGFAASTPTRSITRAFARLTRSPDLPGASGAFNFTRKRPVVWRILQTRTHCWPRPFGAGKTYTMVAAAMESRRLGLSGKTMFVCPNNMLGQFSPSC